ncbi:MAG: two-component regulator propeller domain-containing protein [Chitinophagaceae bacterium]
MAIACRKTLLLICFLWWLAITASAQLKCKVEYYSTEQGLSHQAITDIIKDREGFMWFGSWDGINRFDGRSFVSYKSYPGDMSQLGNDRIDQVVEDQTGHFWIEAYDKQIYRFDKKNGQYLPLASVIPIGKQKINFSKILNAGNDVVWLQSVNEGVFCVSQTTTRFTQYKKGLAADFALPSDSTGFFHEDTEHNAWVGTTNGLARLVRSAKEVYKNVQSVSELTAGKNFTAVDEDADRLYFSTTDGSLYVYDKKAGTFSTYKLTNSRLNTILRSHKTAVLYASTGSGEIVLFNLANQKAVNVKYSGGGSLNTLYEDKRGMLWIEPEEAGVILFNPADHSFRHFEKNTGERLSAIGNRFKILEDSNDMVWVNMKGGGFGYYNTATASIEYVLNTPESGNYTLPNIVYTIYPDDAGILWITTNERRLIKIILQGKDFRQRLVMEQGQLRSDNETRGICYDHKNRLWIGAKSGKLYVYDEHYKQVENIFENEPAGGPGAAYSIMQDSKGNIWLGTKLNGLYKATPVNKEETKYRLTHFVHDKNDSTGLPCNEIYSMLEDKLGRIWIGSFDAGLVMVQEQNNTTQFVQAGKVFGNYPKSGFNKIRHMALDKQGNIWIGTTNGLLVMEQGNAGSFNQKFASHRKIPGDRQSIGNNDIQYIYRDAHNRMWLSTSGGGFCQAIGEQPFQALQFRNYTTRDGMPNDYVLGCVEDRYGALWIATENGLSKFNPATGVFRNYDSYDGLPRASFSEASCSVRREDGELSFGTTKGYVSFHPDSISNNRIAANIAFTHLQINNEDAGPAAAGTVIENDINYVPALTLKYNQDIISIDYAVLDQRAGNRHAVVYRLVGFDSTWHDDRQLRRVTYTNLPPGEYVFEVKSLSNDLYSNTPYKRLAITILPPPWKTWWAWMLYILAAGVIGWFIRRNALAMIKLRNKIALEQKLAALKLNFFTNVSHELRTPLTLIINPLEQLARKEKLSADGIACVDVARKNANRMVRFINQLLDLRKVESNKATVHLSEVEMITFTKRVADHFADALTGKRIRLQFIMEQKELVARVDAEKMDVVIYNLLGNAIKFTPEDSVISVYISSIAAEESFSIAIADQGPGVEQEKLKDIFELFYEGEHPAERAMKGTGIGLALCRELVQLHGGSIWAVNNPDGGLTVTFKIRSGTGSYKKENISFESWKNAETSYVKAIQQKLFTQSAAPVKGQDAPLVLLVEDNEELSAFLQRQLGEIYRVEAARDGAEGLQKARELAPDLIVSDIMMPVMDGIQMLYKLKNDVSTSHIPVVLLSARYSVESQIEGLEYGADYYITKPFNNDFLVAAINNLLRQRKKLFESLVETKKSLSLSPGPIVVTSKDEYFLKEVIRVVEEKMTDPGFNIETVVGAMNMSRTIFYKKFKSLTGIAPVEFVRDMRLQRARQYLDAGEENISEVAYWSGFNNPKYFSTCFRDKYHVSPSEYIKAKQL